MGAQSVHYYQMFVQPLVEYCRTCDLLYSEASGSQHYFHISLVLVSWSKTHFIEPVPFTTRRNAGAVFLMVEILSVRPSLCLMLTI